MSHLNSRHKDYLGELFAGRVRFDKRERKLYAHDVGSMPKLIKPLLGNVVPDAVVQPQSEEELVELAGWALENEVALTPRGKATSGYGGVLPVDNGVVVDFYRMQDVLSIDEDRLTATVQPGITWKELDRQLERHGLTLRLYPTSYPSSTVGGWLAQGGAGIGSFEYGYFAQNVTGARVVLPSGDVRELHEEELALVADAEGITGMLSEITLRVQPAEELEVMAVAFASARPLRRVIEAITEQEMPVWSLAYTNPRMAALKNQVAREVEHGHSVAHVELPEQYILHLTYRESDTPAVEEPVARLAKENGGELLETEVAEHEWENRFKLMSVKRLGPSLVPTEVVVPLEHLDSVIDEIEETLDQPIVEEGIVLRHGRGGKPEAVILGFIPSDERTFSYHLVFSLSLTVMNIARKYGGRPYATGLYFSGKASEILGPERAAELRAFKDEVDPTGIMNPGKVVDNRFISSALELADHLEPVARPLANAVDTQVGERFPRSPEETRDIPDDIAYYAYACSQCGYCVDGCTEFYCRGWESDSPRGKWYWLREYLEGREEWDQDMVNNILACTTCERCDEVCSIALPIEPSWLKLRGQLIEDEGRMTFPPFEMMAASLEAEGGIWAGYRKDRANWLPEELWEEHGPQNESSNVYFAGCTASYVETDIGESAVHLLDEAGVDFTYLGEEENCCATPMLIAGKWELFVETMKANIEAVKEAGGDTVITSCPACDMMWRKVYPEWAEKLGFDYDIEARNYSEVVAERIATGNLEFPDTEGEPVTVTIHDSCHIGRASGVYDAPREMAEAVPNTELVEMAHNRDEALCCGSVLTLIHEPDVAADLGAVRLEEAIEAGADKVLALCPCCQFQFKVSRAEKELPIEIQDLAHYAAEALGHEIPVPDEDVMYQWSAFEAMIALMTPEGFAALMCDMWPELIDAMPFGMGRMMRAIGRMGSVGDTLFGLMKPMFPLLFPRLLPMMMPRVMPTMLEKVEERIDMPDYMQEQLPTLMPQVMDNLMPHMIDDVVPLVTEPMIDYLQNPEPVAASDETLAG